MNHIEQIKAFEADLDKLVTRYCEEFDLPLASAIGVLEIKKVDLINYGLGYEKADDHD